MILVKPERTVLMGTLLGTIVMMLVAWTEIWYIPGSPSFGTKLVCTIETNLVQWFPGKDIVGKISQERLCFPMCVLCVTCERNFIIITRTG